MVEKVHALTDRSGTWQETTTLVSKVNRTLRGWANYFQVGTVNKIQRVGEAQQPLRAMRAKARDGFIKALRDAHRWLDELLVDPTQTIESLAIREGKSERSIRMTLSLAFMSPALAEAAMEGRPPP